MSTDSKRNLSGIICLISAVFMMFCIWTMISHGLQGEAGKVKLYFLLMILAFAVSLVSGFMYQYYRTRSGNDWAHERIQAEVNALAEAGKKPATTTVNSSLQSQPDDPVAPPLKQSYK